MSSLIARASESARAGDRETLDKSGAILRASIASINGVVEPAWAADRQWKQRYRFRIDREEIEIVDLDYEDYH